MSSKQQQSTPSSSHSKSPDEHDYTINTTKSTSSAKWDYYIGMMIASIFTLTYFVAPFYMISAVYCMIVGYPSRLYSILYSVPMIVSALIPSRQVAWLLPKLYPICVYFQYEEIHEKSPIHVWDTIFKKDAKYLCVFQPHGVISFAGICSACTGRIPDMTNKFPTAVADALLYTPIVKHIMGIFGLISASKSSLQRIFRSKNGAEGCIVLYVGGLAELFLSNQQEEVLYLLNRKGFIKLALQEGVDVLPIYLFGNTSVLSVLTNNVLATLSRKLQVSLTYVWGRFYLPIPRDCKLLYVSGQPLGMLKIEHPTQMDVDHWHQKYCSEVTRIFNTYKERVPEYKHKTLRIV